MNRFPSPGRLTAYSGTVPRLRQSGDRRRHGATARNVNHYLKWAYVEAANAISRNRRHWPEKFVVRRYESLRARPAELTVSRTRAAPAQELRAPRSRSRGSPRAAAKPVDGRALS